MFTLEGFKEAAEKFQEESGTDPGIELSSLDNKLQIREAVQDGRLEEAITMVNDIHPELLDTNRYLYFHLQVMTSIGLLSTSINLSGIDCKRCSKWVSCISVSLTQET